jgi:hypothetical protein
MAIPNGSDSANIALPILDEDAQRRFVSNFPNPYVKLPSLAKPQQGQIAQLGGSGLRGVDTSGTTAVNPAVPPASALPPVTAPTPVQTPEEQRVAGIRSKLQTLEKTAPATTQLWQKAGQYHAEHPGIIGRLGQIGAGVLRGVDIGAETLMPNVAANIPGSILNRNLQVGAGQRELKEAETQAGQASERSFRTAQSEKDVADAAKARRETELLGQPKPKEEEYSVETGRSGPHGESVLLEKTSGAERYGMPSTPTKTPAETQEQNKLKFQSVVGKLDAAGLATGPTGLNKGLDEGLKRGVITPEEHALARSYQAANPTPATNLQVHVAGQETGQRIRDRAKFYTYTDSEGKTQLAKGDAIPPDAEGVLPVKDPEALLKGAQSMNAAQKSFNQLARHDLTMFDDPRTRSVLATALDEAKARQAGLLIAGTGGSLTLPSGAGHIIDQFLLNNAIPDRYRSEAKEFIADYYSMKDKLIILQMASQGGKMGRSMQSVIQAMFAQLPGLATADSAMAKHQLGNLQEFMSEMKQGLPEKFGNYQKEPDFDLSQQGERPVYVGGKLVGYTTDGKSFSRKVQ